MLCPGSVSALHGLRVGMCACASSPFVHVCVYVEVQVCVCVWKCVFACACARACIDACMHVLRACMHACMCGHACMCMLVHMRVRHACVHCIMKHASGAPCAPDAHARTHACTATACTRRAMRTWRACTRARMHADAHACTHACLHRSNGFVLEPEFPYRALSGTCTADLLGPSVAFPSYVVASEPTNVIAYGGNRWSKSTAAVPRLYQGCLLVGGSFCSKVTCLLVKG